MNRKKLFKDLSANTIQTGTTQLAGLLIFYLMSRYIPKADFGEYSWATAVGSTIIAIGSLGLDFVLVKRIASGQDPRMLAGIHFLHTLLVGFLIVMGLLLIQNLWPDLLAFHPLLLLVIIQLILSNIANSIKFSLTGLEQFKSLAIISGIVNLAKLLVVLSMFLYQVLSVRNIMYGFICASFIEFIISLYFINKRLERNLSPILSKTTYIEFVRESLPQLGVVLFDSALARVDWILLGIFSTATITAEYSFAYKFFELSKLPLLILAPVLLTRFTKLFISKEEVSNEKQKSIQQFFNIEIFISFLIPIFMVCAWTELIDLITEGKYGAVNQTTYTILAICVPLHFVINFLWTTGFVQGQLKEIMYITISSSVVNLILNLILIPYYGSIGSAISFLLSCLLQLILYLLVIIQENIKVDFKTPVLLFLLAASTVFICQMTVKNNYLSAFVASFIYITFAISFGLVSIKRS